MRRVAGAFVLAAAAAAVAAQGAPQMTLTAIDGRSATGALTIGADGAVRVAPAQGDALALSLADVLSIEAVGARAAPAAGGLFVWLRSGATFPATRILGAAAQNGKPASVTIATPSGAELTVPLSSLAALRCRGEEPRTFAADRQSPDVNNDLLYAVKDGKLQRFSVTVESLADGKVHFDLRGTAYDFALEGNDATAAIVFGKNTGFAPDRQGKPRVSVALTGGEVFEGRLLQADTALRLRFDEGCEVSVPMGVVRRIDVLSDKLTWLSTLEPKAEQTPAFDRVWPWTLDRSPAGPGIVIAGKTYGRGLELVPRTRLTYDLAGKYDVFEAVLGIDDRGGPQAHAILRVLVDGKVAFESEPLVRGSKPKPVRVDLGKCKQLAIEADFGKNFDLGDLCAFADARVLQQ
jgi:hypothetical protein